MRTRLMLAAPLIEALISGHTNELSTVVNPMVHVKSPAFDTRGIEALIAAIGEPSTTFSQIDIEITALPCVEPHIITEWIVEARHTGPLIVDWAEIEPTGRLVTIEGALIGTIDGSRIASFTIYYDEVLLLESLGLL